MPELYEYFGLIIIFYTNEHEPVAAKTDIPSDQLILELLQHTSTMTQMEIIISEQVPPKISFHSSETNLGYVLNEPQEFSELRHAIRNLCMNSSPTSARQMIPENILLPGCLDPLSSGPAFLEILPVDICNHACNWCFTAGSRSTRMIQPDRLRTRLDEFIAGGGKTILFSGGGEPLLYKPFIHTTQEFDGQTVVEWLAAKNITIGFITNGVFLDKFILANPRAISALAFIRVSLDACTASKYVFRHQAKIGDFERVIDGIKSVIACRGERSTPAVGISFVVDGETGMNAMPSDIGAIQKIGAEIGIDYIQLKHAHTSEEWAADATMLHISTLTGMFDSIRPEFWVHRYFSSKASPHCLVPVAGQLLRSDGARSPCCHLQGVSVPEYDAAIGFTVKNCHSPACRYVSMNKLLKGVEQRATDYFDALVRLKHSLERHGFHPYRLFPSAPDLAFAKDL